MATIILLESINKFGSKTIQITLPRKAIALILSLAQRICQKSTLASPSIVSLTSLFKLPDEIMEDVVSKLLVFMEEATSCYLLFLDKAWDPLRETLDAELEKAVLNFALNLLSKERTSILKLLISSARKPRTLVRFSNQDDVIKIQRKFLEVASKVYESTINKFY